MLIIIVDTKSILHKEFVLEGETANSACHSFLYGEYVKMFENFIPNFGDKDPAVASREHFLFHLGIL
jgi:hypothetical protein